jgi:hypothetical protein
MRALVRGLALLFGGAMTAVLVGGIALSEIMDDPGCTEGPCAQDVVKVASVIVFVFIGVLWLIAAVAYEADRHRERDDDSDR